MGNPPFVGYGLQSKEQKDDIMNLFVDEKGKPYKTAGKIDYVAGWYYKAAMLTKNKKTRAALVSTNSITQGEQVAAIWEPLKKLFGIHIDFAHRTFKWNSEATLKAHVHCVILGFSTVDGITKFIYDNDRTNEAKNINAYLVDAEDVFVSSRSKPICNVPIMTTGNRPADGGHLIIEADEYEEFVRKEPEAIKYIKRLTGAQEYINNKPRYCLWLKDVSPSQLRSMPLVMERVKACRDDRLQGAPDRQKLADTPWLFRETNNYEHYIIVPAVSSEKRKYIPLGFMDKDTIPTNLVQIIPDATLYHFGVLTSNVHMAWMRAVCGRLKSDYRYSKDIVYNNFPWPSGGDTSECRQNNGGDTSEYCKNNGGDTSECRQNNGGDASECCPNNSGDTSECCPNDGGDTSECRQNNGDDTPECRQNNDGDTSECCKNNGGDTSECRKNKGGDISSVGASDTCKCRRLIEQTAQAILDARALYPDSSLADLYDELTMPHELRRAHQDNDRAVMQAYGFSTKMTESECVAELFKLYQKLTGNQRL